MAGARATSIPWSASTAAPVSRCAPSRPSARTDRCQRLTSRSSTTTGSSSPRSCPAGTSALGPQAVHPRWASSAPTPSSSSTGRWGPMLDGHVLIDAHVHVPVLGSLRPAWVQWARDFGPPGILDQLWDTDGRPKPAALDDLFDEQGVDAALLFCEYSPKATGYQPFEDLLPIVERNPQRFRPVANVNPHLHFPIANEVRRQLDLGAAALKLHPVHGGFRCDDPMLYPAYQVLAERGVPLIVHCGTSTFPGSMNELADPQLLLPVVRDFPTVDVVLAHGGRGWWYDAAAFMALSNPTVWLELSGLPPKRLPDYYRRYDLGRLARRWIFGTDWPGVPGTARNARAVAGLGLPDDVVADVLGGNASRVYAGLPPPPAVGPVET